MTHAVPHGTVLGADHVPLVPPEPAPDRGPSALAVATQAVHVTVTSPDGRPPVHPEKAPDVSPHHRLPSDIAAEVPPSRPHHPRGHLSMVTPWPGSDRGQCRPSQVFTHLAVGPGAVRLDEPLLGAEGGDAVLEVGGVAVGEGVVGDHPLDAGDAVGSEVAAARVRNAAAVAPFSSDKISAYPSREWSSTAVWT